MPGYRNIGGTWKPISPWRNIAGAWKAGVIWRNIAGVWKVVAGQLTVQILPSPASASSSTSPVSTSATAFATNGIGPYSYLWSQTSGGVITLLNATSATATFRATLGPGQSRIGTFSCAVTDAATGLTATASVDVELDRT